MKPLLRIALVFAACFPAISQAQTQMPLPTQSNYFNGNARGYYFVAPTCFTITGAMIPTNVSAASQNIAIVRLDSVPPVYAAFTNSFTTLFLTQNDTTSGIISCNIQVNKGDIIGVIGERGTDNSYGTNGYVSNINGIPTTLNRLGMQYTLNTNAPQDLWSEPSGVGIGRVFLYYTAAPLPVAGFSESATAGTVTFTNTSSGATGYFWNFGDSQTSSATNPTNTYAASGTYTVCLTAFDSCGDSTTTCHTIQLVFAGVENIVSNTNVTLYPNPFHGQATLDVNSTSRSGAYALEIYDLRGALVTTQQGMIGQRLIIDGSTFAPGVYVYKVVQKSETLSTGKLVITE